MFDVIILQGKYKNESNVMGFFIQDITNDDISGTCSCSFTSQEDEVNFPVIRLIADNGHTKFENNYKCGVERVPVDE